MWQCGQAMNQGRQDRRPESKSKRAGISAPCSRAFPSLRSLFSARFSLPGRTVKQPLRHLSHVAVSAVLALLLASGPSFSQTVEIIVPTDQPSIQAAITAAASGNIVVVEPGTYQEAITLKDGVEVRGRETARTFLSGGGGGPVVTVNSAVTSTISSFTFINALVGIQVANNPSLLSIMNNVFQVGTINLGKAITVASSPGTSIINNTFNGNGTAIDRDADIMIVNNIFANNTTAIIDSSGSDTNTAYNAFFHNTTDGPGGANGVAGDPFFVDPTVYDFHLQEGSPPPNPCVDTGDPALTDIIDGSPSDIGAYGGPLADPLPFPVSGLTVQSTTATSIDLVWSPNNSYLVTNSVVPGGYWVYYGYASGVYNGTDAFTFLGPSPSPIDVGPDAFATLLDLNPVSLVPSTPVLAQPVWRNASLALTWSASTGATGYKVHYGTVSPAENTVDVGNATAYTLTGLTNGVPYRIAVSAYAEARYYFAVLAYDSAPVSNKSALSPEVTASLSQPLESGLSNIQIETPDTFAPYPLLPDSGGKCFIATAAYGSYSAPEVRALHAFRDRYLATSAAGRLFVRWYYRHGPAAAALLNAHPAYKPAVRAALLPAVGVARALTNAPALFTAGLMLLAILSAAAFGLRRIRRTGRTRPR